jgi:antitoxin (DNA-binding transcriptional repressor) of toxin-antitoxin stability system
METITRRKLKDALTEWLRRSQLGPVIVLRHGEPVAVILGVEGKSLDDVYRHYGRGTLKRMRALRLENGQARATKRRSAS